MCNAGHVLERRLGRIFENVGKTLRSLKQIYTDHITELWLSSVRLPLRRAWALIGGWEALGSHNKMHHTWASQSVIMLPRDLQATSKSTF